MPVESAFVRADDHEVVLVKAQVCEGKGEFVLGFHEMPLVFVVEADQLVHGIKIHSNSS